MSPRDRVIDAAKEWWETKRYIEVSFTPAERKLYEAVSLLLLKPKTPAKPRSPKQREWDAILETLALIEFGETLNPEDLNSAEWSKIRNAAMLIRQSSPQVTPEDIRGRLAVWNATYPDIQATANALAANWRRLGRGFPKERKPWIAQQLTMDQKLDLQISQAKKDIKRE